MKDGSFLREGTIGPCVHQPQDSMTRLHWDAKVRRMEARYCILIWRYSLTIVVVSFPAVIVVASLAVVVVPPLVIIVVRGIPRVQGQRLQDPFSIEGIDRVPISEGSDIEWQSIPFGRLELQVDGGLPSPRGVPEKGGGHGSARLESKDGTLGVLMVLDHLRHHEIPVQRNHGQYRGGGRCHVRAIAKRVQHRASHVEPI